VNLRPMRVFMMDLWATVPYYTAYLSRALAQEGVDVQAGSISYYLDPACFSSRGVKPDPGLMDVIGRFRLPKLPRRLLKFPEAMLNLAALVIRFAVRPPGIVHVQYLPMLKWKVPLDLWFLQFCRQRGAKIVLTVHDLLPHDSGEIYKATFARLYAMVDAIICHSEAVKARLAAEFGISESKVAVIPHGPFFYDMPAGSSESALSAFDLPSDIRTVLWQGIIFPYKGVDLLLSAWQQVESRVPDALLVIAGTGAPELLAAIRTQVAQLGLKRVRMEFRFVSTEELVALYRRADIVVYPYRAITTSGALATGLALGKTIVASDLPVFRELLTNGENALLVPPLDTGGLAGALSNLLEDDALREKLSERIRAMSFGDESWLSIAEKTTAVYQGLIL
jgi:glycosyltransferase involved in cell wall biosynthesis